MGHHTTHKQRTSNTEETTTTHTVRKEIHSTTQAVPIGVKTMNIKKMKGTSARILYDVAHSFTAHSSHIPSIHILRLCCLTVDELKAELANRGLPTGGLKKDLIERLKSSLTDAELAESQDQSGISSKDWQHHRTRKLLIHDIKTGNIPLSGDAWLAFNYRPEYAESGKMLWEERLENIRAHIKAKIDLAEWDKKAMIQYRQQYPVGKYERESGRMRFSGSPAEADLKLDVSEGRHKLVAPTVLHQSRSSYRATFKGAEGMEKFRNHIYKMDRRFKYNDYIEDKKETKIVELLSGTKKKDWKTDLKKLYREGQIS